MLCPYAVDDPEKLSASALFSKVDTDHSGRIDLKEFEYLHSMIVKGAKDAAMQQAAAQRKIEEHKMVVKFLKASVFILLTGLFLMLGGNAGLTAAVVFLSKDTQVDGSGEHS